MAALSGTNLAAPIVPFTDGDDYATHQAVYGSGGVREVATVAARNLIPAKRRTKGMVVRVTADPTPANITDWEYTGSDLTADNDLWEDKAARKADNTLANVTPLTGRTNLGFGGTTALLSWGTNTYSVPADGLSDKQAYFFQTQTVQGSSLGAGYFQRLTQYPGGALSDASTPVNAAARGYTQIDDGVNYCNEVAVLGVTDSYSWHGQAVGIFGQANSYEGGRTFGLEAEAISHPKIFTATAAQTVFVVPNGYTAGASTVTKNGTVLVRNVDYTETAKPGIDAYGTISAISGTGSIVTVAFSGGFTPPVGTPMNIAGVAPNVYNGRWTVLTSSVGNATLSAPGTGTMTTPGIASVLTDTAGTITLASGATAGDTVKVWRGNPQLATIGGEVISYAESGPDTYNAISGNRIGLAVYAWRTDPSLAVATTFGTVLSIVVNPSDTYLTAERGMLFQGRYNTAIDFTASNFTCNTWLMKFNTAGGGLDATGKTLTLYNLASGGLLQVGDGTANARFQAAAGSGVIVGSETNTDFLLWRNAIEAARFTSSGFTLKASSDVKIGSNTLVSAAGNLNIGSAAALDTSGYGVLQLYNATNGGLAKLHDGTNYLQMQTISGGGAVAANSVMTFGIAASEYFRLQSDKITTTKPIVLPDATSLQWGTAGYLFHSTASTALIYSNGSANTLNLKDDGNIWGYGSMQLGGTEGTVATNSGNTTLTVYNSADAIIEAKGTTDYIRIQTISGAGVLQAGGALIGKSGSTEYWRDQSGAHQLSVPIVLKSYTIATVPSVSAFTGQKIWVSDMAGGAGVAVSDGTNWRKQVNRSLIAQADRVSVNPTTGQSISMPNGSRKLRYVINSGALAALTVAAPSSPEDGDEIYLMTTGTITNMTLTATNFSGRPSTMNGSSTPWTNILPSSFVYDGSNGYWTRLT